MCKPSSGSGQSLLSITNDILDLSKIDAGRLDLESIAYDPARVLKEVVALFSARASAKGLTIEIDVSPDVPNSLMGDPGRLRQVLSNLLGNSLKFTHRQARFASSCASRKPWARTWC